MHHEAPAFLIATPPESPSNSNETWSPVTTDRVIGRRVIINLEENQEYANQQLYKHQTFALWYTAKDLKAFRRRATKLAQAKHVLNDRAATLVHCAHNCYGTANCSLPMRLVTPETTKPALVCSRLLKCNIMSNCTLPIRLTSPKPPKPTLNSMGDNVSALLSPPLFPSPKLPRRLVKMDPRRVASI
jgi:hypothetical protein